VTKNGAYYSYDGESIGQGREKARAHLLESPATVAKLRAALLTNPPPLVMKGDESEAA